MERPRLTIPEFTTIGGQAIVTKVIPDYDKLGEITVFAGELKLAQESSGKIQSPSSMFNTYWHEITHGILDTMGESRLSRDEKFVSTFSSFLTEVLLNATYPKDGTK